jgi:capsular exopolysaccharide synthesis family protein
MYQNAFTQPSGDPAAENPAPGLMRSINLRDLWAPIYRSRFAIIAIIIAVFSLAVVGTLLMQPLYRSVATVEIRSETQKVLGTEDSDATAASSPADAGLFLDTQLDIIRSRSTATAVAQSLGLYNDDNFLQAMAIDTGDEVITPEQRRKLVNEVLLDNLEVRLSEETRIAQITFSSPDAALAQRVANSYAENYIRLNLARRFDASSYSLDFLRNQIREAQERLGQSERQAIAYARRADLLDTSNAAGSERSGPGSLTAASLVGLNQALSDATARRIEAEQRWNVARRGSLMTVPQVAANPSIQRLQQDRALLQSQLQEQLALRTATHPAVVQLQARLETLDQQISAIGGNVRSSLREEYTTARAQEDDLRNNISSLRTEVLDEQGRSIQLSILQREANTNREQLDALLQRYNELNAQSGVQLNNLTIIDPAEVSDGPYWPSVPLNVALALVVSVFLSVVYVLVRENLFEMIRTPDDVSSRLHLPLLGAVPVAQDVIGEMGDPKSDVSESLNSIRTSLSLSSPGGFPRSLMLTSTQAGEGKSTVCYGLAQGMAKLGRSVIIIDADLRRPNIHRLFELKNTAGVSNILSGAGTSSDYILHDVAPNIDVIVAGPIPPDASELLAAGRLQLLVRELSSRYDFVLVDSAPVLGLADAPLVSTSVEGIVYVIEATRNTVRSVQSAMTRVQQGGTPVLGAVLSRFDPGKSGYSYEYRYTYNYSYGTAKAAS